MFYLHIIGTIIQSTDVLVKKTCFFSRTILYKPGKRKYNVILRPNEIEINVHVLHKTSGISVKVRHPSSTMGTL